MKQFVKNKIDRLLTRLGYERPVHGAGGGSAPAPAETAIWEDQISRFSYYDGELGCLEPASNWASQNDGSIYKPGDAFVAAAVKRDSSKIPLTDDREGYYGDGHFNYWLSGLRDMGHLVECGEKHGVEVKNVFDFGCASGRVLRHFAHQRDDMKKISGLDLNRRHVDWIQNIFPGSIDVAQGHSIPSLPYEDNTFDMVSAFSVFTHIEAFETTWLLELKRILKPGGLAWITIHSEDTWREMEPGWPLYGGVKGHADFVPFLESRDKLPSERTTFRWLKDRSYSSNVFFRLEYIERVWTRIFELVEVRRRFPEWQDVLVLRKSLSH